MVEAFSALGNRNTCHAVARILRERYGNRDLVVGYFENQAVGLSNCVLGRGWNAVRK